MLEKVPASVGRTLGGIRAGMKNIVFFDARFEHVPENIAVSSLAFEKAGSIPMRYTEDGKKLSPPLASAGAPPDASAVALIIEDADSPTPHPLVHAIAWNLPASDRAFDEGALKSAASGGRHFALGTLPSRSATSAARRRRLRRCSAG